MTQFSDELVDPTALGHPDGFFDRFVINLHPTDRTSPSVLIGLGVYPARRVMDGFVVTVLDGEQRNLRFSTVVSMPGPGGGVGPFTYEVVQANRTWRISLSDNPSGVILDGIWTARAPYWLGTINVANAAGAQTAFEHLFQSGRWSGHLAVDAQPVEIDGWWGQRDRSRGVRSLTGGQGLHLWLQAQFPERSVGLLFVESRTGETILLKGAVMSEGGTVDDIVAISHRLVFDDLDLRSGVVRLETAGNQMSIEIDASARGGFMAGAGYGGHHGVRRGVDHIEYDRYRLDGTVTPRTLDTSLTDRLARFTSDGESGSGIVEFALTRSQRYRYHPTL